MKSILGLFKVLYINGIPYYRGDKLTSNGMVFTIIDYDIDGDSVTYSYNDKSRTRKISQGWSKNIVKL